MKFTRDSAFWWIGMASAIAVFLGEHYGALQKAFPMMGDAWHARIELMASLGGILAAYLRMSPLKLSPTSELAGQPADPTQKLSITGKLALLLLLGLPAAASAQTHVETMPVAIFADHVQIGATETKPRRLDAAQTRVVVAGQTMDAPTTGTFDTIEASGTLKISRTQDTSLKVTDLVILPGGFLDAGTAADPIPCGRKVEIIGRDVPIDLATDRYQWGNGLVSFGHVSMVSACHRTPFVESAGTLIAGQQTIPLASAVTDWRVGDELEFNDTRTVSNDRTSPDYLAPRRETQAIITSVSADGLTIGLSKPLDFEHNNVVDPEGTVVQRPFVANRTRNIIIRSENPDGTRWHTVDVGHGASYQTRGVRFEGLGRTKLLSLDDSTPTHVGTNEKGRYAVHHHHIGSCPTCWEESDVAISTGLEPNLAKWAFVLHFTSDTRVEGNIALGFPGSGFTTEDGYEVRNLFKNNFAAYNLGHTVDEQGNTLEDSKNIARNCTGCNGNGFWERSVQNYYEGNVATNNFLAGFDLFNQQQPDGMYPSQVGGDPDTILNHQRDLPLSFIGNRTIANVVNGLELWGVNRFQYKGLITAHNSGRNVYAVNSDHISLDLSGMVNVCAPPYYVSEGSGNEGVSSSQGYVSEMWLDQSSIRGCSIGITGGGGANGMHLSNSVLQNAINIDMFGQAYEQTNVLHKPLANLPHRFIVMTAGADIWPGPPTPLPKAGLPIYVPDRGSQFKVRSWQQQAGQDYLLYFKRALAQNLAWYSTTAVDPGAHTYNPPVQGLTNQQAWDQFGMGAYGDIIKQADALTLDGVVDGLARQGLVPSPLPPPRAVVMFPTLRDAPIVESGNVRIFAWNTGDFTQATPTMWIRVDNDAAVPFDGTGSPDKHPDDRVFTTAHGQPGFHDVEVWRGALGTNARIPGSGMTARYCIGVYDPAANTCEGQTTTTLPPSPPTITSPLRAGDGIVRGFGVSGALVQVFVDAVLVGEAPADGAGAFSRTVDPLLAGQLVTATQQVGTLTSALSATVTVAPVVTVPPPPPPPPPPQPPPPPPPPPPAPVYRICLVDGTRIVACTPELGKP